MLLELMVVYFVLQLNFVSGLVFAPDQKIWAYYRFKDGATHYRYNGLKWSIVWEKGLAFWNERWYFHIKYFHHARKINCKFQIRLYDNIDHNVYYQKTWR